MRERVCITKRIVYILALKSWGVTYNVYYLLFLFVLLSIMKYYVVVILDSCLLD